MELLLNESGHLEIKDMEKAKVLKAFFTLVLLIRFPYVSSLS